MTTLGCDPEFTILDDKGNPVPAHSIGIPSKEEGALKKQVGGYGGTSYCDGSAFRDGYNVEINVKSGTCRAMMSCSVRETIKHLVLPRLPAGYTITAKAAFRVALDALESAPQDVKMFGCSPSLCAYTGQEKRVILDAATHPWRYAGGHLHFGTVVYWKGNPLETAIADPANHRLLIKMLDMFVGVPLAVIYNDDAQWERRKVYGQAGEYRAPVYVPFKGDEATRRPDMVATVGVEYRVPPPELFNHHAVVTLFTGVARQVISDFKRLSKKWDEGVEEAVRAAVNTGDGAEALIPACVPGYYTRDHILRLRDLPDVHTFQLPFSSHDTERGWGEFARDMWNMPPIPPGARYDYDRSTEIDAIHEWRWEGMR